MAMARSIGMLVLAIWLILYGVTTLGVAIPSVAPLLGLLALIAGVAILAGR